MDLDPVLLSRLQFALTISFHYLFPPLSIGLGWLMVIMEGMYLKTGEKEYESIARFWTGLFAVVFAMGVATGIVMEVQFGTNWSTYSRYVGDVFGSALAAEGIFAFFLESGFLAVLVFGWDRVGPKMHFFSTVMVAVGALFSSVWITVANSWQQTPAGHHIVQVMQRDGTPLLINGQPQYRAEIVDFWAVVFNPSSVHRLLHVWLGAGILGAFFVLSIAAYYMLRNRHVSAAEKMFKVALPVALILSLLAPLSGHFQAQTVAETQPAKLAAFEGHFETGDGPAPLYLWGWPDQEAREVRYGAAVPGMLTFLVHEDFSTPVTGLDQFPETDWPPVWISFQTYHIMVALGMYFIAITVLATFLYARGALFRTRWLLWLFVFSVVGPYIANQTGWAAAEVGRQPWIVYGLLRTSEAYSPSVGAGEILFSMIMFGIIYIVLFILWIYIMDMKIRKGPEPVGEHAVGREGFMRVAGELADHAGPSMTSARSDDGEDDADAERNRK